MSCFYICQELSIQLAKHCMQNNHEFDLVDMKIVDRCSQWSRRLFLEAWHSIHESNSINEHVYIPDIYTILPNLLVRFS